MIDLTPVTMTRSINKAAVVIKPEHAEALATARELQEWLAKKGIEVLGEPQPADAARDDISDADLIVVLGATEQ